MQHIAGPVMMMLGLSPSASLVYYFNTTFALVLIRNGWVLQQRFELPHPA
jgi:hypothetical protein